MVQEAVEHRADSGCISQKFSPVFDGTIRSQHRAGSFIPSHDDLQQFFSRGQWQLTHPEIVEDEQGTVTRNSIAIKREVHQLVDRQIETLRQPSGLTTSDLSDYRERSEKITTLYHALDQMRRANFERPLHRAS